MRKRQSEHQLKNWKRAWNWNWKKAWNWNWNWKRAWHIHNKEGQ